MYLINVQSSFIIVIYSCCFFRCVLATLSANGNVYIHSSKPLTGKWYPILNITDKLFHYLMENNWLDFQFCSPTTESTETYLQFNSGDFERHKFRKHLLFTTSICWCPTNIPCNNCLQIPDHSNLSHYHSYHSYVKCKHSKLLFLTASKNGYMFLWLITLFLTDDSHHSAKLLLWWKTDTMWPISSGIQQSIIGCTFYKCLIYFYFLFFQLQFSTIFHATECKIHSSAYMYSFCVKNPDSFDFKVSFPRSLEIIYTKLCSFLSCFIFHKKKHSIYLENLER